MIFADGVILLDENTNVLEAKLERWRELFNKKKLKIYRAKTKILEFRLKNKKEKMGEIIT